MFHRQQRGVLQLGIGSDIFGKYGGDQFQRHIRIAAVDGMSQHGTGVIVHHIRIVHIHAPFGEDGEDLFCPGRGCGEHGRSSALIVCVIYLTFVAGVGIRITHCENGFDHIHIAEAARFHEGRLSITVPEVDCGATGEEKNSIRADLPHGIMESGHTLCILRVEVDHRAGIQDGFDPVLTVQDHRSNEGSLPVFGVPEVQIFFVGCTKFRQFRHDGRIFGSPDSRQQIFLGLGQFRISATGNDKRKREDREELLEIHLIFLLFSGRGHWHGAVRRRHLPESPFRHGWLQEYGWS